MGKHRRAFASVTFAAVVGLITFASTARATHIDELRHEKLAREWLVAHGVTEGAPAELKVQDLVSGQFVHLRLGAFALDFPDASLRDKGALEDLREGLVALVRAQESWVAWLPPEFGDPGSRKALAKDAKVLTKWLGKWKTKDFAKLGPLAGRELAEALQPPSKVAEALDSMAGAMSPGSTFGSRLENAQPPRLVLLPRRSDFVEFACVVGLVIETGRHAYWAEDVYNWTEIDFEGSRALALEFAAPDAHDDYARGVGMKERNPLGLVQHVTQLGTRSLLESTFGDRLEPMVAAGLANSLIVDTFGELDTRSDGDLRSSNVDGRSMFIPAYAGGRSGGGGLPPGNADSRWRKRRGKDHFVRELRAAQEQAAKDAPKPERALHFRLESDGSTTSHDVRAPFLGVDGNAGLPPAAFQGDYVEFLRAYRTGFLHWLRAHGGGSRADSEERFGQLLVTLADPEHPSAGFPSALEAVYGIPLSAATPGEDDLEGRFLLWVGKQR